VIVEAMTCGTPVAAFGVGAVPELVQQGVGGCWVPPDGNLGEAVRSAVQLNRRRVREAAVERFDYRRMVDAYERLYRRLAQPREQAG
jgi:glycosyltransferase involved in cell wall biosynthesis